MTAPFWMTHSTHPLIRLIDLRVRNSGSCGSFWTFCFLFLCRFFLLSSFPSSITKHNKRSTMMPPHPHQESPAGAPPAGTPPAGAPPPCPPRQLDGNQIGFLQQQGFSSGKKKTR
jgi:hypothetical protein